MNCPTCKTKFTPTRKQLASELGKLSAGKPKKFSVDEIKKRTARLTEARKVKKGKG